MCRRMMGAPSFIVLFAALSLASPIAQAKTPYAMPTFGVSWASGTIDVSVPANPAVARDLVLKAAQIWNEAQLWFKATYFPKGHVYTFLIGKRPTDVLVDFTDYWSVSNYCPSMPLGVEGCTNIRWNHSRNITEAIVFLDTKRLTGPDNDSIFLVLHELGHVLGLPDLPSSPSSSCQFQDLFCLYYADQYPSTLDLYALHELAGGNRSTTVSLPSDIPYYYYAPTENLTPASTGDTRTASPLNGYVTPSTQYSERNSLAALLLAAVICFGAVTLIGVKLSKRCRRSCDHDGPGGI